MKDSYLDFDEYIVASEPHKREKAEAWKVAIGLQAVDGLQVSEYLKQTARRHIEGEITIDEAKELVNQYYVSKTQHDDDEEDKQEASVLSHSAPLVLSPSIGIFSAVYSNTRDSCATTTSPRMNGCCGATQCFTAVGRTCGWRWIMTSRRRRCSTIRDYRWWR